VKWDKEDGNFEANFELNDVEMSVIFNGKGEVLETETEIETEDLPEAVKTALNKDFAGYDIEEAAKIVKNGTAAYEAQVEKGETKLDAVYSPDGILIKKIEKKEKDEESEKAESGEEEENKENEHPEKSEPEEGWQQTFKVNKNALTSIVENSYFILKHGYQLTLSGEEDGKNVVLVVTVLNETQVVDGAETRIVEERETHNGSLVEVSRNYYAIDPQTKHVYCFGETVYIYKDGKVIGRDGAWESGKDGAHFGLMMPGRPQDKQTYYQEAAPKIAMDRAEIESLKETLNTPAGAFTNCLKTEETTPLEPGVKEYKMYAPGVG